MKEFEYMRQVIFVSAVSLFLGLFIGHVMKRCPECQECVTNDLNTFRSEVHKAIEIEKTEIKKETNEKILEIITSPDVSVSDSILRAYAKTRFNYNQ